MTQPHNISSDQRTSSESKEFVRGERELEYSTSNSSGTTTSGKFILTFTNGAVIGRRVKQKQNGNEIPPETSAVDGYFLNNKLKLYREVLSDNVVQIYDVVSNGNEFTGQYYNIGGNRDSGSITIQGLN